MYFKKEEKKWMWIRESVDVIAASGSVFENVKAFKNKNDRIHLNE